MSITARAVLTADVHYNINTYQLADKAMRQALAKAEALEVPFIVAGDLHDTKANLHGVCVKALIDLFKTAKTKCYVIVGNHCLINVKSKEHSLEFLRPYVTVVDRPLLVNGVGWLLPYYDDHKELEDILSTLPSKSLIIAHQGVQTAFMGHYQQDKSSLPPGAFKDFRVISGHYHRKQDVVCGRAQKGTVGLFSYIGNPYSLTFGEAQDGPKGYQVLMSNGLLEFVPTNLRKHVVITRTADTLNIPFEDVNTGDLVWLKVSGKRSELTKIKKKELSVRLPGVGLFKFDLIPTDTIDTIDNKVENRTGEQIFDQIIDSENETPEQKKLLKKLWRELL